MVSVLAPSKRSTWWANFWLCNANIYSLAFKAFLMKIETEVPKGFAQEGKKVILHMNCENCRNKFRALTGKRRNMIRVKDSLPSCFLFQNIGTTEEGVAYEGRCITLLMKDYK